MKTKLSILPFFMSMFFSHGEENALESDFIENGYYFENGKNPFIEKIKNEIPFRINQLEISWTSFAEVDQDSNSGFLYFFAEHNNSVTQFRRIWWRADSPELVILDVDFDGMPKGLMFSKITGYQFCINSFFVKSRNRTNRKKIPSSIDGLQEEKEISITKSEINEIIIESLRLKRENLEKENIVQVFFDSKMKENVRFWRSFPEN